jgi:hypothetical protein
VIHGPRICNGVSDADTEAVMEEPIVDNHLQTSEQLPSSLRALLSEHNMNQTPLRGSNSLLFNDTKDELAVFDHHAIIEDRIRRSRIRRTMYVHTVRDRQAEDIVCQSKQALVLKLQALVLIPLGHPKKNILDNIPVQESVAVRTCGYHTAYLARYP